MLALFEWQQLNSQYSIFKLPKYYLLNLIFLLAGTLSHSNDILW